MLSLIRRLASYPSSVFQSTQKKWTANVSSSVSAFTTLQSPHQQSFDHFSSLKSIRCRSEGSLGSLDFALFATDRETGEDLSFWHDIPYRPEEEKNNIFHMVVEIQMNSRAKMEMSKETKSNPIIHDTVSRDGGRIPRFYSYGRPFFNYGFIPQTWEDPSPEGGIGEEGDGGEGGDDDPIDVIELSGVILPMGSICEIRVVGNLQLIDQGEVDHKILAVWAGSKKKENVLSDNRLMDRLRDWLVNYKTSDGKAKNVLRKTESDSVDEAIALVENAHIGWKRLKGE